MGRALARLPGVATPDTSGPVLASIALDDRWAHLRDGAFVVRDKVVEVRPVAHDRDRETRLWEATGDLLDRARQVSREHEVAEPAPAHRAARSIWVVRHRR